MELFEFDYQNEVCLTTLVPTHRPTKKPTPTPTQKPQRPPDDQIVVTIGESATEATEESSYSSIFDFYPHYGKDGTSAECRDDGDAPRWIKASMMKLTQYECCRSYFFPQWEERCTNRPYYPDFKEKSCINDGKQPQHMGGDYLANDMWECCYKFYQNDEEALSQCTGT